LLEFCTTYESSRSKNDVAEQGVEADEAWPDRSFAA